MKAQAHNQAMIVGGLPGFGEDLIWRLIDAGIDVSVADRGEIPLVDPSVVADGDRGYRLLAYFLPETAAVVSDDPDSYVHALLAAAMTILTQIPAMHSGDGSRIVLVGPTTDGGWPSESLPARGAMILVGRLYRAIARVLAAEGIHFAVLGPGWAEGDRLWEGLTSEALRRGTGRFRRRDSVEVDLFDGHAA